MIQSICVCVYVICVLCGGQRSTLGVLLYCFWPYVWNNKLTNQLPRLVTIPQVSQPMYASALGFQRLTTHIWLLHEGWAAEFRSLYSCRKPFRNWFTSLAPPPSKVLELLTRLKSVPGEFWAFAFFFSNNYTTTRVMMTLGQKRTEADEYKMIFSNLSCRGKTPSYYLPLFLP